MFDNLRKKLKKSDKEESVAEDEVTKTEEETDKKTDQQTEDAKSEEVKDSKDDKSKETNNSGESEDDKKDGKDKESENKDDKGSDEEKNNDGKEKDTKSEKKEADDSDREEEDGAPVKVVTKSGVATLASNEELAQKIQAQLLEHSEADYWTIRVRKQSVLLAMGVALLTMWLVPVVTHGYNSGWFSGVAQIPGRAMALFERSEPADMGDSDGLTDAVMIEREEIVVRVKYDQNQEYAESIAELIETWGYQLIDVIEENEGVLESGIEIVVKRDQEVVRAIVQADLGQLYRISSASAELTDDSDFDAVIIIGDEVEPAEEDDQVESETDEPEDEEEE